MGTPQSTFEDWYRMTFGAACPLELPSLTRGPGSDFFRAPPRDDVAPGALALPGFLPGEYTAVGLCGYGPQSTYFVLTRTDAVRRHYFRLPFAGTYVDTRAATGDVREFLSAYARWEQRFGAELAASHIVYSTGDVDVTLRAGADQVVTLDRLPQEKNAPLPPPAFLWEVLTRVRLGR